VGNRKIRLNTYKPTNKEYNQYTGKIDITPWETQIIGRKAYRNWKLYRKKQYRAFKTKRRRHENKSRNR